MNLFHLFIAIIVVLLPVPEDQFPVELPDVEKYQPTGTGESPLAAIADWVNVHALNVKGQQNVKLTPCLNGQDPAGTFCAIQILI